MLDDWPNFVQTLHTQFGPVDPTADIEDGINSLKMHDSQHIVKYNVEFNCICTSWDEGVLQHHYYSGLAECIKDIMGQQRKPLTLAEMKTLAHHIDSRHWECFRKKSHARKTKFDNNDNKPNNKGNKSDDKKNQASGSNKFDNSNKNNKFDKNKKPNKPQSSSGNSTSIANKLGKDRKLTLQERQCHFDNNLCMFCGGPSHSAKDCPKSSSSASKAKAQVVQAKAKEAKESSDSKKD